MRKRSQTNLSQTTLNPLQRWKKSKSSQALSPLRPGSAGISSNNSAFYNLDLPQDKSQIYNKDTRWYCKDKIDNVFHAPSHLPYSIENHLDQGQYLYHVVMNLYVSIASLDIRGLIPLSPNELNQLITNLSTENNASQSLDEDDVIDDEDVNQELEEIDDEEIQIDENQASEELTTGPNYNIMGKITSKSSTIINVNHWTHELKNCLSFPLPLSLRKSLVTVYYYLALTQGQRIYRQLYVEMLESLIDPNDHGNNFTKLLRDQVNLRLDHKPLFQFISEFLPYPDPDYVRYDIQSKDDLQLYRLLLKLSHISRPFFDKDENILND